MQTVDQDDLLDSELVVSKPHSCLYHGIGSMIPKLLSKPIKSAKIYTQHGVNECLQDAVENILLAIYIYIVQS